MRTIASETAPAHRTARASDAPQNGYGGSSVLDAIRRHCAATGRGPNEFRLVASQSTVGSMVLDEQSGNPCPDCGGTGRCVGLAAVETRPSCGGTGPGRG
jgi:hypothetical protein